MAFVQGARKESPMSTLKGTKGADTTTLLASQTTNIDTTLGLAGNDLIVLGGYVGHMQSAYGGSGNDQINGTGGIDRLYGDVGNDLLSGNGGKDSLYGGVGNDTIQLLGGPGGHSVLVGYSGNDSLIGATASTANDISTFSTNQTKWFTQTLYGGDGNDAIAGGAGVASDNHALWGGAGNDSITAASMTGGAVSGVSGQNHLYGEAGNDTLTGSATVGVKDTMTGGAGADSVAGGATGAGNETVSYLLSANGVAVSLATGSAQSTLVNNSITYGTGGDQIGDQISGVNNVIGSGKADMLVGTSAGNKLFGGAGNDVLDSGVGNTAGDSLYGGYGNDKIYVNTGTQTGDVIDGGAGIDTLDFFPTNGGPVTVDLSLGTFSGANGSGTINGIEKVSATLGNDTLTAVGGSTVYGMNGNDSILSATSGSGKDVLIGGLGTDTYNGSASAITDYFEINRSGGIDQIIGFNAGGITTDKLYISVADYSGMGLGGSVPALGTAGTPNTTVDILSAGVLNAIYNSKGILTSYSLNATDVMVVANHTTTMATAPHAVFIYDSGSGDLFFIPGSASAATINALTNANVSAHFDTATFVPAHGTGAVLDSTDFVLVA